MSRSSDLYRNSIIVENQLQLQAKLAEQHRFTRTDEIPIYGGSANFNMNDILTSNIYSSRYFFKILDIKEFDDIIDEAVKNVRNLEPLVIGTSREPSSAFCILFKLFLIRMTVPELRILLNHENAFVCGIGFLYMRFAYDPRKLWDEFSLYFDDDTPITPFKDNVKTSIGKWLIRLLQDKKYGETLLPSIPIPIKREIDTRILKLQLIDKRVVKKAGIEIGDKVHGLYSSDLKWYPAVVTQIINDYTFVITYDVHNNSEIRSRAHILVEGEDPYVIPENTLPAPVSTNSSSSNRDRSKSPTKHDRIRSHSHSRSRSRSRSRSHSHKSRHSHDHRRHHEDSRYHDDDRRSSDRHHYASKYDSSSHKDKHSSRDSDRDEYKSDRYGNRKDEKYSGDGNSRSSGSSSKSSYQEKNETPSSSGQSVDMFDEKRLAELVRERERAAVVAEGDHYADHVHHVKASLMMRADKFGGSKGRNK